MRLQLSDTRLLKESVSIISEIVNEVTFRIDKGMMSLLATDPANVAMIDFKIMAEAFAEYDVQKPLSLSVTLDNLKAILKRAKPDDSVILSLDEDKNRLTIELVGSGKRTFNLALIDRDEDEQRRPNLKFTATVLVPSSKFDDAIADMEIVSDSVALMAESGKFAVRSEGNVSDAHVELLPSDSVKADEPVNSRYAISYLAKMSKGSKLADNLAISFSQDYPLELKYIVENKLELAFVLAPRVSND